MAFDWLAFVALSIAANTPAPIAFDPVLLVFAEHHAKGYELTAAAVGAIGAGTGGLLELLLFRRLGRTKDPAPAPTTARFYVWVAFVALIPIPFTVARVAAYTRKPRLLPYALAIVAGRLPRHGLIVLLATELTLPFWITPAAVILALSPLAARVLIRRFALARRRSSLERAAGCA